MNASSQTAGHCTAVCSSGEFAEFHRPPHRDGVELYRAELARLAFAAHVHEAYGIGAIAAGVERFSYAGGDHLADAGTLVFMHPDVVHTGRPATAAGWRYGMLYLDPEVFRELIGQSGAGTHVDFSAVTERDPARAVRFLNGLECLWRTSEPLEFDSRLVQLIDDCVRPSLRSIPSFPDSCAKPRFKAVREAIEERLDSTLRLADLAVIAGLSPFHFVRAFRDAIGSTPHAYILARRVARAKRLLAAGLVPAEAAARAGFNDQSHLNRWLYRTHGTTPGRYQQQSRPRLPT